MDILASPVSPLLLLPSNHRQKLTKPSLYASRPKPSSPKPSSPKPYRPLSLSSPKPLSLLSTSSSPPPPLAAFTRRTRRLASTGYAAALIDSSRRGGAKAMAAVGRDVRRLADAVASITADCSMAGQERAEAVLAAAESGGFDRRVVALTRMVVARKRGVEELIDVLDEFGRLWREMTLPAAEEVDVVVASEKKMGIRRLAKIAGEVRRACGAVQVNMKHLFCRRSPRFAL